VDGRCCLGSHGPGWCVVRGEGKPISSFSPWEFNGLCISSCCIAVNLIYKPFPHRQETTQRENMSSSYALCYARICCPNWASKNIAMSIGLNNHETPRLTPIIDAMPCTRSVRLKQMPRTFIKSSCSRAMYPRLLSTASLSPSSLPQMIPARIRNRCLVEERHARNRPSSRQWR
jgi:hypothetical protein